MKHSIIAALILSGCILQQSEPDPVAFHVGVTFSPDDGVLEQASEAAQRLSTATGIPFTTGEGGVRVQPLFQVIESTKDADGNVLKQYPVCGHTTITFDANNVLRAVTIQISVDPSLGCWDQSHDIEHEMIHAIRAEYDLNLSTLTGIAMKDMPDEHSRSGVFAPHSGDSEPLLDAASLAKVCEAAPCSVFNVER